MIRRDTIAPFPLKTRNRTPTIDQIVIAEEMADNTLCGQRGSKKERHCQLFKLTVLAILPGLILIVRNAVNVAENVKTFQANQEVKGNIQFSLEISAVIHSLQIERGTTALYVSSDGDPFVKPRLNEIYQNTDTNILSMSSWLASDVTNIQNSELASAFSSRDTFHQNIRDFRKNLNPRNITLTKVIGFYTDRNRVFIDMIAQSLNLKKPFVSWTDITSYQMLIFSKEQAGIERALGSTYFARGSLPAEDHLWYNEKQILGRAFLEQSMTYSSYASDLIRDIYFGSALQQEITRLRKNIINNTEITQSVQAGALWFDNMTEYINKLHSIQENLAAYIVKEVNDENNSLEESLTISSIEFIVAVIMVPVIIILVHNIIRRIHKFSIQLKEKTKELEDERKRTEELLYQLLPRTVAKRLIEDGSAIPEAYHSATIMFSDVVGFTMISSASTPMQVINMLNMLYLTIDTRLENFDVYKVETIGDGYMVASGIPNRNGEKHVEEIARLSLDLLHTIEKMVVPHLRHEKIKLRLGVNTGPCVAGVVGVKMPRYCIFGDTVNTASRMESTGMPSKIQMTESTTYKLRKFEGFIIKERGVVEVKGKGVMRTFWLEGYEPPLNVNTLPPLPQTKSYNPCLMFETPPTTTVTIGKSVQQHSTS